jgi:phosphoglycolate phosphatase-like HAD superfamily hydrolase
MSSHADESGSRSIESESALVVFDMDGVLIDVSASYRETVRQTARLFLKGARSWEELPDPLFPLSDLAVVKQSGGLNNDWDLTFAVINLLFERVKGPAHLTETGGRSLHREGIGKCDVSDLVRYLKSESMPLSGQMERTGKRENDFVSALYTGDVGSGNVIKQIFQEVYLGKDLFESIYPLHAQYHLNEGFIIREKLLIPLDLLKKLSDTHILAIATGRPRIEADYPLDLFNLRRYFTLVYSLDDCLEEERRVLENEGKKVELSKPHPFMLDAIARSVSTGISRRFYIGDMPDDMMAASRSEANYTGIGIVLSAPNRERLSQDLEKAGADHIIDEFDRLPAILDAGEA